MISFIVIKKDNFTFRNPLDSAVSRSIDSLSKISNLNLKKDGLSVICEAGDIISEQYLNSAISIFNDNPAVGAVYSNYTFADNKVYVPSFCRQRLVSGLYVPPLNCVVRNLVINKVSMVGNSPLELFLKITDNFAMYHIAEFLIEKPNFYTYTSTEQDFQAIHEYFNSDS